MSKPDLSSKEQATSFINQTIKDTETPYTKDLMRKSTKITEAYEIAFNSKKLLDSVENYISLSSNIVGFCLDKCNSLINEKTDGRQNNCSKSCVAKYMEQLRLYSGKREYYRKGLFLDSIYFQYSENLGAINKLA
mmetsp:Transcript_30976/g.32165  ORF Transcript_30976/g.32165 Transcript_30976/m.32165 type:complete len:135 (-) Transcript_30976:121-525(-)